MDWACSRRRAPAHRCVRHGQRDVVRHAAVHQLGLLQHESDPAIQLIGGQGADVVSVNRDRALGDVVEAGWCASVDLCRTPTGRPARSPCRASGSATRRRSPGPRAGIRSRPRRSATVPGSSVRRASSTTAPGSSRAICSRRVASMPPRIPPTPRPMPDIGHRRWCRAAGTAAGSPDPSAPSRSGVPVSTISQRNVDGRVTRSISVFSCR